MSALRGGTFGGKLRSPVSHRLAHTLLFALLLGALSPGFAGCGTACGPNQVRACVQQGDCMCGARCTSQSDCSNGTLCLPIGNDPSAGGACVDPLWALTRAGCRPACSGAQVCVSLQAGTLPRCAPSCQHASDCESGCCVPLQNGGGACASGPTACEGSCSEPCPTGSLCVALAAATCLRHCANNGDCPSTCCLALEGGDGACAPESSFCPPPPPPVCSYLGECAQARVSALASSPDGCAPGSYFSGGITNFCSLDAVCQVCWFRASTGAYDDCAVLGPISTGVTRALDGARCLPGAPMPAARVRCVDTYSFQSGHGCLQGPQ